MSSLANEFVMKDLGQLSFLLGISVTPTGDSMFLSQNSYAQDIIKRAGMQTCKPTPTPVNTNGKLGAVSGVPFEDSTLYCSMAGALWYFHLYMT